MDFSIESGLISNRIEGANHFDKPDILMMLHITDGSQNFFKMKPLNTIIVRQPYEIFNVIPPFLVDNKD